MEIGLAKVMLVDDDINTVHLQKTLLELEGFDICLFSEGDDYLGFDICLFSEGDDYLNILSQELPDAVLMDVYLENYKLNGLALLDQTRKHPEFEHIKIIMSSGIDFQKQSKQQGADGFLQKPYMPEELINLLKEMLL